MVVEPINVNNDGKSQTLKAQYIKNNVSNFCGYTSTYEATGVAEKVKCVAQRGRYPENPKSRVAGLPTEQMYEAREDEKTNTLTTVQKDNMIAEPIEVKPLSYELESVSDKDNGCIGMLNMKANEQCKRIYSAEGKCATLTTCGGGHREPKVFSDIQTVICKGKEVPVYEVKNGQITIKGKQYPIKLQDGFYIIRKLTVRECMRLQTVPEWYDFSCISNSRAYKCLGNGWTVEVIKHLISSTLKDKEDTNGAKL